MSQTTGGDAVRAARQMVRTSELLGVDFVPLPSRKNKSASAAGKQKLLDDLRARHDRECPHCTTATAHTQTVFGEGNPEARLVFVGEAPGAEEDRTGRPFVGRAGELLNKMITAMGLSREEIYIGNVLKSRPPNNATPTPAEVMKCAPYLAEQLKIIAPEVIVALGAPGHQVPARHDRGHLGPARLVALLPPRRTRNPRHAHLPSRLPPAQLHPGSPRQSLVRPPGSDEAAQRRGVAIAHDDVMSRSNERSPGPPLPPRPRRVTHPH